MNLFPLYNPVMPIPQSPERLTLGLTLDRDFSYGEDRATEHEQSDIPTAHHTCKVTEAGGV